jgi:hypothetical protein
MYRSIILDLCTEVSGQLVVSFTPGEEPSVPVGGWVALIAGLAAVEKIKICHCRESNTGRPVHSPSLYRLASAGLFRLARVLG